MYLDDAHTETRARQLQAEGPDEFPFGYYQALAELQLRREETMEHHQFDPMRGDDVCMFVDVNADPEETTRCCGYEGDLRHD